VKNAEAVTVFATLAPRSERATVVRAIIALQVAIDIRDEAEERGRGEDPELLALLARLGERWRALVVTLPAWETVRPFLDEAVQRCEQAQIHTHRATREGPGQLRDWARDLEVGSAYRWWEVAAGASSSVAAHALISAAADPATTFAIAGSVNGAYQPAIGALTVFLDDLVDREEDLAKGEHNYLAYYESPDETAGRLALIARRSEVLIAGLPRCGRHRAILAGVAAYYLSDAAAGTPDARPIRARLLETMGPGAHLLAGFMRIRRLGERKRPGQAGNSPGP